MPCAIQRKLPCLTTDMFALIDGNNFYASCERVFQPELRQRPLIVLSNNDGCAIARSEEAKALGVAMGQPVHLIPSAIRSQLAVRSANFPLYGDMSRRVLDILRGAVARVEAYSIDEAFLDLTGVTDVEQFARGLHQRVQRWTGIPNCIGIGPTKTLAKLANHIAKEALRKPGLYPAMLGHVCYLSRQSAHQLDSLLQQTPATEVWGVGRRWGRRLHAAGIETAAHLRLAPSDWLRAEFGVVLARTQRELCGIVCHNLVETDAERQQIVVSRSFGHRVYDADTLVSALAQLTSRAAEKLRLRGLVAQGISIFAYPDPFERTPPPHQTHCSDRFVTATADTRQLLGSIRRLVDSLFCEGIPYKKAGVCLWNLRQHQAIQDDLFATKNQSDPAVMATLDAINRRFGRGCVGAASALRTTNNSGARWHARRAHASHRFTTCIDELAHVRCD